MCHIWAVLLCMLNPSTPIREIEICAPRMSDMTKMDWFEELNWFRWCTVAMLERVSREERRDTQVRGRRDAKESMALLPSTVHTVDIQYEFPFHLMRLSPKLRINNKNSSDTEYQSNSKRSPKQNKLTIAKRIREQNNLRVPCKISKPKATTTTKSICASTVLNARRGKKAIWMKSTRKESHQYETP